MGGYAHTRGINSALAAGEPKWVPSVNTSFWELRLDRIAVGEDNVETNGGAILQSIGDSILVRREVGEALMANIDGARNFSITTGMARDPYVIPCGTDVSLTFSFGGVEVAVPPSNWIMSEALSKEAGGRGLKEGECLSRIHPADTETKRIVVWLGWAFFASTYTVLQYGEQPAVGFAPLTDSARGVVSQLAEGNGTAAATIPGHSTVAAPTDVASGLTSQSDAETGTSVNVLPTFAAIAINFLQSVL